MQKHEKIYKSWGVRFRSDPENTCPQNYGGGGAICPIYIKMENDH